MNLPESRLTALQQFCLTMDDSHQMTTAREHIQEIACAASHSRTILELGSHQGFSAAAIAIANPQAQVVSVDLCDTIPQEQRVEYWNKLGIKNIFPVNSDAASYLAMCLRKRETFDFIFHDALHGDRAADEYISCSELTQALAIHDWEQLGSNYQEDLKNRFHYWNESSDVRGRFLFLAWKDSYLNQRP